MAKDLGKGINIRTAGSFVCHTGIVGKPTLKLIMLAVRSNSLFLSSQQEKMSLMSSPLISYMSGATISKMALPTAAVGLSGVLTLTPPIGRLSCHLLLQEFTLPPARPNLLKLASQREKWSQVFGKRQEARGESKKR